MDQGQGSAEVTDRLVDRVRETAKWLVGTFAGIGAALIAGSQLSSIGKLKICTPVSVECSRLWIALLGAVLALVAIGAAILATIKLMLPAAPTLADLSERELKDPNDPAVKFFVRNPEYRGGFDSFKSMRQARADAVAKYEDAVRRFDLAGTQSQADHAEAERAYEEEEIRDIDERFQTISTHALQESVRIDFEATVKKRLRTSLAVAAAGIVVFAWAANPPNTEQGFVSLRGAHLRGAQIHGAQLRSADLTGADLTSADLRGSNLMGATIDHVLWAHTICPDGTNSDLAGGSCLNHLTP